MKGIENNGLLDEIPTLEDIAKGIPTVEDLIKDADILDIGEMKLDDFTLDIPDFDLSELDALEIPDFTLDLPDLDFNIDDL